jgi:hypothetical protein
MDSSPSALTPSSSKDSSSTGSSTREATDALLGDGGRKALADPTAVDPVSMLVLTENLTLDFGSGGGALEALDEGGIEALLEHSDGLRAMDGLKGGDLALLDGLDGGFADGPGAGDMTDLMDWRAMFGGGGDEDDVFAIPGWAQDTEETTL